MIVFWQYRDMDEIKLKQGLGPIMTRKEVAAYANISISTVKRLDKEGVLVRHPVSKRPVRYRTSSVLAYFSPRRHCP